MSPSVRECAVLIVDVANSVRLMRDSGHVLAERRIRHLLDLVIAAGRLRGGSFVKSYGDDVLMTFENADVTAAAHTAICAQRDAAAADLALYAGLHVGPVEFRDTMGHPDAVGLAVNTAARLHKLTEGVPGQIFLAEESLAKLSPELRERCNPYGPRELKSLGSVPIWTLDWRQIVATVVQSGFVRTPPAATQLVLRHHRGELRPDVGAPCLVGRGPTCDLRMPDPQLRISATHLQIEFQQGCWMVHDVSRNGTWLREAPERGDRPLPFGMKLMLPASGALCLGRAFAADPAGRCVLRFEILEA